MTDSRKSSRYAPPVVRLRQPGEAGQGSGGQGAKESAPQGAGQGGPSREGGGDDLAAPDARPLGSAYEDIRRPAGGSRPWAEPESSASRLQLDDTPLVPLHQLRNAIASQVPAKIPPPPLPFSNIVEAIAVPEVPRTPMGVEQLRAFRNQMAGRIVVSWVVPVAAIFATLAADRFGHRGLTALFGLVAVVSGALAPGLTVVFAMRSIKAGARMRELPALPAARLHLPRRSSADDA